LKYRAFFQKGATSVVARFDYWGAAVKTTAASPIFGTGPGTFFVAYQRLKRPESEPARLVHNDYLEQASDSGLPGAVLYAVFIVGVLWKSRPAWEGGDWEAFAIWLGLLGWALQGFFEFGLYIPALAWPAFTFMGWLLSQKRAD
jgi:O-antigen ligase